VKGYPFEVGLPDGLPINDVILADQIKSLDWQVREVKKSRNCPIKLYRLLSPKLV
jgi:mRNA interferase MazF